MNELTSTRTLDQVAAEIRAYTGTMLTAAIEIGRRMEEAKGMLNHGEFGGWITSATPYSVSAANNFMRLYREYGEAQGSLFGPEVKSQTFGNLTPSKALALLALPEEEREEFVQNHDVDDMSTRELKKAIAERDAAREDVEAAEQKIEDLEETAKVLDAEHRRALGHEKQRAEDAEARLKKAKAELREAKAKAAKLAAAPAPTVEVVEDKAATAKAVKAAREETAAQISAAEEKVKALERDLAEARQSAADYMAKAADAEAAAEEARKTAGGPEVAALKKQLALADPVVAEFRGVFDQTAAAIDHLIRLYDKATPEKKPNLANAMAALAAKLERRA